MTKKKIVGNIATILITVGLIGIIVRRVFDIDSPLLRHTPYSAMGSGVLANLIIAWLESKGKTGKRIVNGLVLVSIFILLIFTIIENFKDMLCQ